MAQSVVPAPGSARKAVTLLAGIATSGTIAVTAGLGSAPPANATCASFFGIGNSTECTSNLTSIAIAIGTGAVAHSDGLFGTAFAFGNAAAARTYTIFDIALSAGDQAQSDSDGIFGFAASLGYRALALADGSSTPGNFGANIAINLTLPDTGYPIVRAVGVGNIAVNLFGQSSGFGTNKTDARGFFNIATTLGGRDNLVQAGIPTVPSTLSTAFSVFGSGNTVGAQPGPVAIAGSIAQTGQTVTKAGPGFNINGVRVFGAAATPAKAPSPAAASTAGDGRKPTATAGSRRPAPAGAADHGTR